MQVAEGLKIINDGWVKKPKGFRVKGEKLMNGERVTVISPPEESAPLDSDVTAWRYAWKLYKATCHDGPEIQADELINIHVIDDTGATIKYYATNDYTIFNPK